MKKKRFFQGSWWLIGTLKTGSTFERYAALKEIETRIPRWREWWGRLMIRVLKKFYDTEPDQETASLSYKVKEAVENQFNEAKRKREHEANIRWHETHLATVLRYGSFQSQLKSLKAILKGWTGRYYVEDMAYPLECLLNEQIFSAVSALVKSRDHEVAAYAEEILQRFEIDKEQIGKPPPKGILLGKEAEAMHDQIEAAKAKEGSA